MTKLQMVNVILTPKTEPQRRYAEDVTKQMTKKDIEAIYTRYISRSRRNNNAE